MNEFSTNEANAWPYLVVVALCVFWLLASILQGQVPSGKKTGGSHASWRASEMAAPLRRFWQNSRRRRH